MKRKFVPVLSLLLGIPSVFAAPNPFETITPLLVDVFNFLNLSTWLTSAQAKGNAVLAIFFITLTVILEKILQKVWQGDENKKVRGVVAFAVSAISVIFIPKDIALIAGTEYGAIASFVLLAGVPGIILFRYYKHVKDNITDDAAKKRRYAIILWLAYALLATAGGVAGWSNLQAGSSYVGWTYSFITSILLIMAAIYTIGSILTMHMGGLGVGPRDLPGGKGLFKALGAGAGLLGTGVAKTIKEGKKERKIANELKKLRKEVKKEEQEIDKIIKNDFPDIERGLSKILKDLEKIDEITKSNSTISEKNNKLKGFEADITKRLEKLHDRLVDIAGKKNQHLNDIIQLLEQYDSKKTITVIGQGYKKHSNMLDNYRRTQAALGQLVENFKVIQKQILVNLIKHLDTTNYSEIKRFIESKINAMSQNLKYYYQGMSIEKREFKGEDAALTQINKEIKEKLKTLKETISKEKKTLKDYNKSISEEFKEDNKIIKDFEEVEKSLEKLIDEIPNTISLSDTSKINQLKKSIDTYEKTIKDKYKNIIKLSQEKIKTVKEREVKDLKDEFETKTKETEKLEKTFRELENKFDKSNPEYSTVQNEILETNQLITQNKELLKKLEKEIKVKEESLARTYEIIRQLELQISSSIISTIEQMKSGNNLNELLEGAKQHLKVYKEIKKRLIESIKMYWELEKSQ